MARALKRLHVEAAEVVRLMVKLGPDTNPQADSVCGFSPKGLEVTSMQISHGFHYCVTIGSDEPE